MKRFKNIGPGTIALALVCMAVVWGIDFGYGNGVGIFVMRLVGLGWLYNLIPNSVYWFSFAFTVPAYIVGKKYKDNFGAVVGRRTACVYACMILLFSAVSGIFLIYYGSKGI